MPGARAEPARAEARPAFGGRAGGRFPGPGETKEIVVDRGEVPQALEVARAALQQIEAIPMPSGGSLKYQHLGIQAIGHALVAIAEELKNLSEGSESPPGT